MREPGDMVTQRCGEGLPAVLGLMQPGIWRWEKIGGDGKGNAAVWWLAKLLRNSVRWCGGDLSRVRSLSSAILSEFRGLALVLTTQPLVAWYLNHVTIFALVMRRTHLNKGIVIIRTLS